MAHTANLLSVIKSIREQLAASSVSSHNFKSELSKLELAVDDIICAIEKCDSFDKAKADLNLLGDCQEILAILCFKHHIAIGTRLRSFVRLFERLDEEDTSRHIYSQIRAGRLFLQ